MSKNISIDGVSYSKADLPEKALNLVEAIAYLDKREFELAQLFESLRIAKHTNIEKLKLKLIASKAGVVL
tara:strand:- start:2721 stop:2930 length:210 start_codon:yes stop_codon:yes gene_type:complete